MTRATLSGPRGELVFEREVIPVHYMNDIDGDWRFTDAAGHRHHCEYRGADHYPTLARVVYHTGWDEDCGEEYELTHLECRQCGEEVTPGMTGPGTKFIQGVLTCTLDGEYITEERAMALAAKWRTARG